MNHFNDLDWRGGVLLPGMMVVLGGCASLPDDKQSAAAPQETVSTYPYNDDVIGEALAASPHAADAWNDESDEADPVLDAELNAGGETKPGAVVINITKIEREPELAPEQDESARQIDSKPEPKTMADARYGTVSCIITFDGRRYDDKLSADLLPDMQTIASESSSFFISKVFASAARDIPTFMKDDFPAAGQDGDAESHRHDLKDYLPGYKNAVMRMRAGKHFLAIAPVSILHNRRVATSDSTVMVYQKADGKWVAQETLDGMSVSYPAAHDKSLALFRWKANEDAVKRGGILGADVLVRQFTKRDFGKLHDFPGRVFYLERGEIHTWKTHFSIKLPNDINPQWRFFR